MAKPADYWQSIDLKNVSSGGLIAEDVMEQIWDISNIPLPFTDAVGSDDADNSYTEWTEDALADPDADTWVVDGADSDQNDASGGTRLGNQCGIKTKEVQVSSRAEASDTIGRASELAYQIMMRQRELRRDVEAAALGIQGSQADDGDTTPGIPAGLAAQATKFDNGSGGSGGAFSGGSWSAWTPGDAQPIRESDVRDACQEAWQDGADPSLLMSVPGVIRKLSSYMFTSSANIATLQRDEQGDAAGTALGSVNVFITDFGITLDFVPNRIQRTYEEETTDAAPVASVFIMDPNYARMSYLRGYRVEPLAKSGLSEKRLMSVDFTVKCLNRDAHRVIPDVSPTADATA